MTTSVEAVPVLTPQRGRARALSRVQDLLPKLVLAPSFVVILLFVYGFILWTLYLSLTRSRMMPIYEFVGLDSYERLWSQPNWYVAIGNLVVFGALYIGICTALGLFLAILLDQRIKGEGLLRPIYLYPMALSFIVTGTAWRWFLAPDLGLQKTMQEWGWTSFSFDWIVDPQMAIYTIVIAGVWQATGLLHGHVSGRPARHRRRDPQGGADRRRVHLRNLSADRHPLAAAGFPVRLHRARPYDDQVVRPRHRADRRRPGQRDGAARRRSCIPIHSPATRCRSGRRAP
jgi:hypothetical protein